MQLISGVLVVFFLQEGLMGMRCPVRGVLIDSAQDRAQLSVFSIFTWSVMIVNIHVDVSCPTDTVARLLALVCVFHHLTSVLGAPLLEGTEMAHPDGTTLVAVIT